MFPFRLGRAIFHFLDFFSVMFSGKPLSTASGPQRKIEDQRYLMLWGRMIDTKQAMQQARKQNSKSLVPKEWQLVCRDLGNGEETVIAERVVSFDVDRTGNVIYTDGSSVFLRSPQGETNELCEDQFVERVIFTRLQG